MLNRCRRFRKSYGPTAAPESAEAVAPPPQILISPYLKFLRFISWASMVIIRMLNRDLRPGEVGAEKISTPDIWRAIREAFARTRR